MRKHILLFGALLFWFAGSASANSITYNVTVNTSSLAGIAGSLDFNFNPGPLVSQAASLQILNFSSSGLLTGTPSLSGNVGGALPATLTFNNGTALNDYFQGFTFGSTLSFAVSLFGPALSSPDGTSTSGSTFAFSMFSNPGGTTPALTTNTTNGFAFTVNVNLDGTTTVTNYSPQTSISAVSKVPEPSSLMLLLTGMTAFSLGTLLFRRGCVRS